MPQAPRMAQAGSSTGGRNVVSTKPPRRTYETAIGTAQGEDSGGGNEDQGLPFAFVARVEQQGRLRPR